MTAPQLPEPLVRGARDLALAWDTPRRWDIIREYYASRAADIAQGVRIDAYELGLDSFLTPIERLVWGDIRAIGLPFLMQYPVGRRFVDFGDPWRRVAIEADGAAFHTPQVDALKDADLRACGWTVYRITGSEIYRDHDSLIMKDIARLYGKHYAEAAAEDDA